MQYTRILDLKSLLKKKSFFLFGPRSTGKTHLIETQFGSEAFLINLLRSDPFLRLSARPAELEAMILADPLQRSLVVIDEVQKIPELLSEIHHLIEKTRFRFLLTGSSARKLKHGQADLLAGRAWTSHLFPLTSREIPDFSLDRYLRYGGLPQVYGSDDPDEELDAYVSTYLKEEISAEGIVRKLPPFSRFLRSSALSNGNLLNFTEMASDCGAPASTVREYYGILEDTLVGFMLEPWMASKKRKAIQTAKFYFFDCGVTHALAGTKMLERNSDLYGRAFEQFIGMELKAYLSYRRIKEPLTFWRSTHGHEVDFLVGDHTGIEVKATRRAGPSHVKGLKALAEEKIFKKLYLVTQDPVAMKKDNISQIPWKDFLMNLWEDRIL